MFVSTTYFEMNIMESYRRFIKNIITLSLFFWVGFNPVTGQNADTTEVLFVGNSYTYFWNLPQVVQAMAEEGSVALMTRQSTAGGATWAEHWRGDKELVTKDLISNNTFDFVVLQNHSMSTLSKLDSFYLMGEQWAEVVRNSGARPILYMTWARAFNPLMQSKITKGYEALSNRIRAEIAPVGLVWERALQLRPDLSLHDPDQSHPSPIGTYLTGCVFYQILTGKSPVGLPARLTTEDRYGEKLYLLIVPPNDAQFCQEVAHEVVTSYLNN